MDYNELLDGLYDQLKAYSGVHRKSVQPFTRDKILGHFPDYEHHFDHEIVRESLLEHVGCLPVIAAYLHPYMDKPVDLGKSLTMLAIHDIGELTVGDELTFLKERDQSSAEIDAALALLHPNYVNLYQEIEALETNEARFVKSVDKLGPDIYDYLCGEEYTAKRIGAQAGWLPEEAMRKVRAYKRPYMEWSEFLVTFHDHLFARFRCLTAAEVRG